MNNTKLIIFTIVMVLSFIASGTASFISFFGAIAENTTPSWIAFFYSAIALCLLSLVAVVVAWITRSIGYGILPLLIVIPVYLISFHSASRASAAKIQANAAYQQEEQVRVASLAKDFTCSDGSFIHIEPDGIGGTDLNYYSPTTAPSGPGILLAWLYPSKNLYTVYSRTAKVKTLLSSCKNSAGKAVTDLYSEEYTVSTYTPKILPITKDEALNLVENIPVVKDQLQATPANVAVVVSDQTYHDEYSNQDAWSVQLQSPPGDTQYPTSYSVFLNNGKILLGISN